MTRIRIVERAGSTNSDILADTNAVEGDWLVALEQSSGKGRQGRPWIPGPGNFFGSTLVEVRSGDPPAPTLSLAAGLALIEAVDAAAPAQALMLKWPNDLMLLGRKLAGILLERSGDRIAVGFGVNLATSPDVAGRKTANLGAQVAPQAFAPLLAGSFARLLDLWRASDPGLLAHAWLARAHSIGTPLTVHIGKEETITGRFAGLEPDGALRLAVDGGAVQIVRAGDVAID